MKRWVLYVALGIFFGIIPNDVISSDPGSEKAFYKAVSKHKKVVALFYGEAGEKGEDGDEMEALTSRFVQVSKRRVYKKSGIIFVLVQAEKGKLNGLLSEVGLASSKLPAIVLFKEGDPILTSNGGLRMLSGTDIERDDIIDFVNRYFKVKKETESDEDEDDDDDEGGTETTVTYYTYVYPYPAGFYVGLGPWGGYGWWGFYPWFGYGYGLGWGGGWYGGRHWNNRHGRYSSRSSRRSSRSGSRRSGTRRASSTRRTGSARRTSSARRSSGRSTVRRSSGIRRGGHGGRGGGRRR